MPSAKSISEQARAIAQTVGVRAREDLAVVRVSGDDARTWLNGQITNDVRTVEPGRGLYALAITVRGKIIADLWVLDRGPSLALLVPEAARQAVLDSFEHQIIMEDVELATDSATKVISVQGPLAQALLAGIEPAVLDTDSGDELGHGGLFVTLPEPALQARLALLVEHAEALGGAAVDDAGFELARVRAGRARFGRDFSDRHYPQEAGLKQLAVSFTKGCYLGQEVVCTLENRGKLTRELARLEATSEVMPEALAELCDAQGRAVGQLTSVAYDPDAQHAIALGYVKHAYAAHGTPLRAGAASLRVLGPCGL